MRDFIKAMQAVELYERNKSLKPFIEYIKPYGYISIDEYVHDEYNYKLKVSNLNINAYSLADIIPAMEFSFVNKRNGAFTIDHNGTWAWVGKEGINLEKAQELGVMICNLNHQGGTIITDNNDINFSIITYDKYVMLPYYYFSDRLCSYLKDRGYIVTIDNNDIMYNGYKVAGMVHDDVGDMSRYSISLSLSDKTELISQLCLKPSIKVPGYITGVTKQELMEEIQSWLR